MTITPITLDDSTSAYTISDVAGGPYIVKILVVEKSQLPRTDGFSDLFLTAKAVEHDMTGTATGRVGAVVGAVQDGISVATENLANPNRLSDMVRTLACGRFASDIAAANTLDGIGQTL